MNLKNSQIVKGVLALRAIPTLRKAPKGAYSFSKNIRLLTDALEPYEECRRTLFEQTFGKGAKVDESHPHWEQWALAIKKLDELDTEIPIHQCSREDLNPAENDINHTHLADIWWMLSDW